MTRYFWHALRWASLPSQLLAAGCFLVLVHLSFGHPPQRRRAWLMLLVSPLLVGLLVVGLLSSALAEVIGGPAHEALRSVGRARTSGLQILDRRSRLLRLVRWDEIREFRHVSCTAQDTFELLLSSGEVLVVDHVDPASLASIRDHHGFELTEG